jgi:hypothetical protein
MIILTAFDLLKTPVNIYIILLLFQKKSHVYD